MIEQNLDYYYDIFQEQKLDIQKIHSQKENKKLLEGYLVNYKDYSELEQEVTKYYEQKRKRLKENPYDENGAND